MTPARIGLAGYGRGGRYFHAPLIGLAPECTLAAVVTRNPRRRAEPAQDLPGVPAADSLRDLAAAGASAVVITTLTPGGFDDGFFLSLRHAGGVVSHLRGDWALRGAPGPRFRVTGSTGTFAVESDDGQAEWLLSGRDPRDGAFGTVPEARWGRIYCGEDAEPEPVPAERGRWSGFYSAFARAVRGEGPLPVDPRDAVAALEVLDAARLSAARGEVVRLS